MRRRGGRKRALGTRAPMALPQGPNQRWSLDFLSDALSRRPALPHTGVVDDFTRECLALVPTPRCLVLRVVRELDASLPRAAVRPMCVSDNGTELTSMAILRWSQESTRRMALHRARQATAECLHRELQRPAARRIAERDALRFARPCRARLWRLEGRLQHRYGRTARSAICRQPTMPRSALLECNGTGRCATSRAPRPVPLHHRANRAQMKPDSPQQRMRLGAQLRCAAGVRWEFRTCQPWHRLASLKGGA